MNKRPGFTIVELLIVIVVIAILASITVVAYNGIQARANNVARVAAASQTYKMMMSYISTYSTLPVGPGTWCLTTNNSCTNYAGAAVSTDNISLITELRKIGSPPSSVPRGNISYYGINFDVYSPRQYNGVSATGLIMYWLDGQNVDCGLPTVVFSSGENYVASSNKYTSSTSTMTTCWVTVPNS